MNPIMAHRGWSAKAPENTIAAFRLAMSLPQVSWIELDVQLSKDGVPVVIHDFTLKRTTGAKGSVKDLTYEELSRLDAGSWFSSEFEGERIPTLDQVLQLVCGRCMVNIELKTAQNMYPGIERKVSEVVRKYHMQNDVMITSFDHQTIKIMDEVDPELATGLIISGSPLLLVEQLREAGASYLSINYQYITEDMVEQVMSANFGIIAWTVNQAKVIHAVARMSPDMMICTNYPDVAAELWQSK